jgi:hypothetical protein
MHAFNQGVINMQKYLEFAQKNVFSELLSLLGRTG